MKKISLSMLNWDTFFKKSMEEGTGFLIDTNITYQDYLDNKDIERIKSIFSVDGIYSYKFGMSNQISNDDPVLKKLYTCKCHKTYGLENLRKVCDTCNTKVRRSIPYREGWIDLGENKILHPYLCWLLMTTSRDVVSDKANGIIITNTNINTDPDNEDDDEEVVEEDVNVVGKKSAKKDTKNRYTIFQLLTKRKLKYTWNDILFGGKIHEFLETYFKSKYPTICKLLKNNFFISKVLVMSAEYRPIKIIKLKIPDITQNPYNVKYMNISECVKQLMDTNTHMLPSIKINYMVDIMKNIGSIVLDVKNTLAANKKALVRGEVYSRRFHTSGRLVLEPIIDRDSWRIDEVHLSLDFFRGVFNKVLLDILNDYPHISPEQRNKLVDSDRVLTKEERDFIRNELFPKVKNPYIYISREPCIYVTSTLGMEITKLVDEMVLRVPNFILPAIAGDYDGDVLSSISWYNPKDRLRVYQALGPKKSLVDTIHIRYNTNIAQNNNKAVLLARGFKSDAVIERL